MLDSNEKKSINYTQKMIIKERSKIIALHNADIPQKEISVFSGRHISTIKRCIQKVKQGGALQDRPRSGCPATFNELIQLKIIAFFCQFTPLPGCNSISLNWAAKYFENNASFLGCAISSASIGRILRKHSLKPHLHKYFLQITDPDFFDILPLIIKLYLNPPKYLFSFDECPGIQILKRLAPSLPAGNGKSGIKYSEPNYNRNGTIDLYSFFDVNTGKIFAKCTKNHKVETLINVFKEHVATLPGDESIHYICDNLSNHSCHEFCRVVAELCDVDYPEKKLDTKAKRQKWLQSENKKIIIHFTPKHGSWLNIVEIWFGILGQKCLKYISSKSDDELIEHIDDFCRTWNDHFAHPFNWTYDGSRLYDQAVKRFIRHLVIENKFMEISFLSKQIELMLNMLRRNFKQVNIKYWKQFSETITEKKDYIENIIDSSDKPRVQKKIKENYSELMALLNDELNKKNTAAA